MRPPHERRKGVASIPEIDVVETFGPMQIDDEVHAGATHAVANGEMIVAILGRRRLDHCNVRDIVSGGGRGFRALPRS